VCLSESSVESIEIGELFEDCGLESYQCDPDYGRRPYYGYGYNKRTRVPVESRRVRTKG
jgi:hypothetical protein